MAQSPHLKVLLVVDPGRDGSVLLAQLVDHPNAGGREQTLHLVGGGSSGKVEVLQRMLPLTRSLKRWFPSPDLWHLLGQDVPDCPSGQPEREPGLGEEVPDGPDLVGEEAGEEGVVLDGHGGQESSA